MSILFFFPCLSLSFFISFIFEVILESWHYFTHDLHSAYRPRFLLLTENVNSKRKRLITRRRRQTQKKRLIYSTICDQSYETHYVEKSIPFIFLFSSALSAIHKWQIVYEVWFMGRVKIYIFLFLSFFHFYLCYGS